MSWEPYRPPWYPKDLPEALTMTGDTGAAAATNYGAWCDRIGAEELQRRIAEYHARKAKEKA